MSLIPPDITDLRDRMDRARSEDRNHLRQEAYEVLRDELEVALLEDPARIVRTAAFGYRNAEEWTAAEIIEDSFDNKGGDASLRELLGIVSEAARGANSSLAARAWNWINARAEEHARFHADDLAAIWAGDDV